MKFMKLEDTLDCIFDGLRKMMNVVKNNERMIIDFSGLRARGNRVDMTQGIASGPVSFMQIYEEALVSTRMRAKVYVYLYHKHPDFAEFRDLDFHYLRKLNYPEFKRIMDHVEKRRLIRNESGGDKKSLPSGNAD